MRVYSLTYHDIVAVGEEESSGFRGPGAAIYKLSTAHFEQHIKAITAAADLRGVDRSLTALDVRSTTSESLVLLHFDDGGSAALATADRLERYGWRGHFHITTDFLGKGGFLKPADVRALHDRGHVIGSHSCSHPTMMAALPRQSLLDEWSDSKAILSDIVGAEVVVASLPGGFNSAAVSQSAGDAGIRILFNSEPNARIQRIGKCDILGRYSVQRATQAGVVAQIISGRVMPRWKQSAFWAAKKIAKRVGGRHWLTAREWILRQRQS